MALQTGLGQEANRRMGVARATAKSNMPRAAAMTWEGGSG